jgi:hypothetical protein
MGEALPLKTIGCKKATVVENRTFVTFLYPEIPEIAEIIAKCLFVLCYSFLEL